MKLFHKAPDIQFVKVDGGNKPWYVPVERMTPPKERISSVWLVLGIGLLALVVFTLTL